MELSNKIQYCSICGHSKRDIERGIVCGLTNEKPDFDKHCTNIQAPVSAIAELEKTKSFGSQKSATKIMISAAIVTIAVAMAIIWLIHCHETAKQARENNAWNSIINEKMETLPQTFAEGITMDSIRKKRKYVKISFTLLNTHLKQYTKDRLICEAKFRHSQMLKYLRTEDTALLKSCITDSLRIKYTFYESGTSSMQCTFIDPIFPTARNGQPKRLYVIVIYPSDIRKALNATDPYRCPQSDFERVLKSDKKALPFDIVDKIQLSDINMDYDANKLTISVRMRRKSEANKVSLTQIVENEIWNNASKSYSVQMAMLNEGTVDFHFIDTSNQLIESIAIGPEFYQNR